MSTMMGMGLVSFVLIGVSSFYSQSSARLELVEGAATRDQLLYRLTTTLQNVTAVRKSLAYHPILESCVKGGTIPCPHNAKLDFRLRDETDRRFLAGTAENPVFYTLGGTLCPGETAASVRCPLRVITKFQPVCAEQSRSSCSQAESIYFFLAIDQVVAVPQLPRLLDRITTEPYEFISLTTEELSGRNKQLTLECTTGTRYLDDPVTVQGDPGAIVAHGLTTAGVSEIGFGAWGMQCTNGYVRTDCSIYNYSTVWSDRVRGRYPASSPNIYDNDTKVTRVGCYTDDEEARSSTFLQITCCRAVVR